MNIASGLKAPRNDEKPEIFWGLQGNKKKNVALQVFVVVATVHGEDQSFLQSQPLAFEGQVTKLHLIYFSLKSLKSTVTFISSISLPNFSLENARG